MDRLKTFGKYILWIVGFYIFSLVLTYIGFNATYKNIDSFKEIPEQINIVLAQSTKVNGRIYGEVTSTADNDLNGKYIKVQIYTRYNNFAGTRYLKIENTQANVPKKFAVNFKAEDIKYYTVEIIDEDEQSAEEIEKIENLYKDIFTKEEIKTYVIAWLVIKLLF